MLTEFDQNTIANMTAALEYVCKRIPADKDEGRSETDRRRDNRFRQQRKPHPHRLSECRIEGVGGNCAAIEDELAQPAISLARKTRRYLSTVLEYGEMFTRPPAELTLNTVRFFILRRGTPCFQENL